MDAEERLRLLELRIRAACDRAGRAREEVLLLPVSKTQPPSAIAGFYALGLHQFGESRVQELLKKKEELPQGIQWHFIGNLQSNKIKYIAGFVHTVHSVRSLSIANELSFRASQYDRTIRILLEVNISNEPQKHGIEPREVETLLLPIASSCPNLEITGLMGMASFEEDPERTRPQFRALRELRDSIMVKHPQFTGLKELSMGMSNDFEVAIEEGATIVRVGSALFEE